MKDVFDWSVIIYYEDWMNELVERMTMVFFNNRRGRPDQVYHQGMMYK